MIKLINIDLDGSLLQEHYIISRENLAAIEYAKSKGVTVCVNTGRNSTSAVYFSEKAGMNGPVVCCGGSLILGEGEGRPHEEQNLLDSIRKRKVLIERTLPRHALEIARDIAFERGISFYAQGKEGYYIVGKQKKNEFVYDWDKKAVSIIDMGLKHFRHYEDFIEDSGGQVVKMGFSSRNRELIDEVEKCWQRVLDCQTTIALGCILEVTCKGTNKGAAVEFLKGHLGLKREEIGCIGDDINDVAMFRACGRTVAIGDGCETVKTMADYIGASCEEHGVAEGIYYLLKE